MAGLILPTMNLKQKACSMFFVLNKKFEEHFGWPMQNTTLSKIIEYLYVPKDASSLAVTRILFGLAMLFDIPDERGGAVMDRRWGDPRICHFPLFPFLRALPLPYMAIVYAGLWLGAVGIALGYKYRASAITFTVCYWYLFLVEKSYWNNHSYLFGLVGLLLACTEANCYWSIDAYLDPSLSKTTVPYWNYFVLKYQFFILYFMAGLKKGTPEWLAGYAMQKLSEHWVFAPFRLFLSTGQIDFLVVHCFIFVFDLTIALWMMWGRSRNLAMLFCALFHLMNSRLFRIGMFPWVCLATLPLFYPFDWPKRVVKFCKKYSSIIIQEIRTRIRLCQTEHECHCTVNYSEGENKEIQKSLNEMTQGVKGDDDISTVTKNDDNKAKSVEEKEEMQTEIREKGTKDKRYKKLTTFLIIFHVLSQLFLPYSHFITKGYNTWTEGLYGYSWDMMVHIWDMHNIVVKVVDNERYAEIFVDPDLHSPNDRWTTHADMVFQYAHCLKDKLIEETYRHNRYKPIISNNISVYIDIWHSMNGRFAQRMIDPKVDLLMAKWQPFSRVPFLMPLMDEALGWRSRLEEIKEEVHSWNNYSNVIFLADFPGFELEKFIPKDLQNVTLTILEGKVVYETEATKTQSGQSYQLTDGNRTKVNSGFFHKLHNIGNKPAFFMYTFYNSTEKDIPKEPKTEPKLPIGTELIRSLTNMATFGRLVVKNIVQVAFGMYQCQ